MIIKFTITGLDNAIIHLTDITTSDELHVIAIDVMQHRFEELWHEIMADTNIPDTYRKALALVGMGSNGLALVPVLEVVSSTEVVRDSMGKVSQTIHHDDIRTGPTVKGIDTGYRLYRCPIHKYMGGTIKSKYTKDWLQYIYDKYSKDLIANLQQDIITKYKALFDSW